MPVDLTSLLQEYTRARANHALGGVRALSGFEYQVRVFLADFSCALTDGATLASNGAAFANALEALSDHTRSSGCSTVCVQVKLTLTRQALASAANEFLHIEEFLATRIAPIERAKIRYECVARTGDSTLSWDQVQFPAKLIAASPDLYARLQRLHESDRLLSPRIEPDPWWRLITTVYRHVGNPFAFAREVLDISLSRGQDPYGARRVRDSVVECFVRHRVAQAPTFDYLEKADFELIVSPSSNVMVGNQPTVHALRDAQFMHRPQVLHRVREALDVVAMQHDQSIYQSLEVFWIEGRSGSGKSVLLLQLMESLVRDGSRVLWLRNRAASLLDVLQKIATYAPFSGPEYVFVDDLYDPQGRAQLSLHELVSLVTYGGNVTWPLIVTCGPPEFHGDFVRDAGGQATLHRWRIPAMDQAESEALLGWYRNRVGTAASIGTAFQQDEGLIVSMMFELRHGNLQQLAYRFRKRLDHADLAETLYQPLALNRLYVLSPGDWLDEHERIQLEAINQDRDFSFLSVGDGASYFKLTHPHLSDAIYRAVRKAGSAIAYAKDLGDAFSRALATDPPTALRLMRVLSTGHERLEIVDFSELAKRCAETWLAAESECNQLPGAMRTEFRVHFAVLGSKQPIVAVTLLCDPLADARAALSEEHPHWVRLWHLLFSAYPGELQLLELGASWASDSRHFDAPYWSILWESMLDGEWSFAPNDKSWQKELITLAICWLAGHEHLHDWNFVWQRLVRSDALLQNGARASLLLHGWRWSERHHDLRGWAYVWERLVERSDTLPSEIPVDGLMRRGYLWLTQNADAPEWSYVWKHLLNHSDALPKDFGRDEIFRQGCRWLNGQEHATGWTYVLQYLLRHVDELPKDIDRDALYRRGADLINGREDVPGWRYLYKVLLDRIDELPGDIDRVTLYKRGVSHLRGLNDQSEWPWDWEIALAAAKAMCDECMTEELIGLALAWIQENHGVAGWPVVWNRLVLDREHVSSLNRQRLVSEFGTRWVMRESDGSVLADFWKKVSKVQSELKVTNEIMEAQRHTLDWLRMNARDKNAPDVFSKLCGLSFFSIDEANDLIEWFAEWLSRDVSHPARSSIVRGLVGASNWGALTQDFDNQVDGLVKIRQSLACITSEWSSFIASHKVGDWAAVTVVSKSKKGYHVIFDAFPRICAFLLRREVPNQRLASVGSSLRVRITHLDKVRFSIGVSRLRFEFTGTGESFDSSFEALAVGQVFEASVVDVVSYGFFVDIGGIRGLLHHSKVMHRSGIERARRYQVGTQLRVRIVEIDRQHRRIGFEEYVDSDARQIGDAERKRSIDGLAIGQLYDGIVANVVDYGLFVYFGRGHGLLHKSKLAAPSLRKLGDLYQKGSCIKVQIIDIDVDRERIALAEWTLKQPGQS